MGWGNWSDVAPGITGTITTDKTTYSPGDQVIIGWANVNFTGGTIDINDSNGLLLERLDISAPTGTFRYTLADDAVWGTYSVVLDYGTQGIDHLTFEVTKPSVPVGKIACESSPTDALILLGKVVESQPTIHVNQNVRTGPSGPVILSNILPGDYSVMFTKDGYTSCTALVTVYWGGVAYAHCTLDPVQTTGALNCTTTPPGAEVYLDGALESIGVTPLIIEELLPGTHTVIFKLAGYEDCRVQQDVIVGQTRNVYCEISLPPPPEGYIRCQAYDSVTNAGLAATIRIDNQTVAPLTPHTTPGLPIGEHTVTFIHEGYATLTVTVTVVEGETVDAYGSMVGEAIQPVPGGFDIDVNIPGLPPNQSLRVLQVVKIPFTETWYEVLIGSKVAWNDITNQLYKARTTPDGCDPMPSRYVELVVGRHFAIFAGDPITAFHPSERVFELKDSTVDISVTKLAAIPAVLSKVCGWFGVSDVDCATSFYLAIPDILFSAEDLSIIIEGKSSYPPYDAKTPTGWNYAFVALTFIPGSGAVKGAGKAGVKAVKSAKLYPTVVQGFLKNARWTSARFPEKQIPFLQTMWDLQGKHLDEVVAQLEIGNIGEADRLIIKYLPLGKSPDLCVKDLHTFTKNIFDKLPKGAPEVLIKEAGLEGSFQMNLGKVIYKKGAPTAGELSDIDGILTTFPKAKQLMVDDVGGILKNTGSTPEMVERAVNAADNYPPIIEELGTLTPLEHVDDLIINAVDKLSPAKTTTLTKTLFERSLKKAITAPAPVALTKPQTDAILNIIKNDGLGLANAIQGMGDADVIKLINSLDLSGTNGHVASAYVEGVLNIVRNADIYAQSGYYSVQDLVKAFTNNYTFDPGFWAELGVRSRFVAKANQRLRAVPSDLGYDAAKAADSAVGREVAENLVESTLMADSIRQIISKGSTTKGDLKALSDLYNIYPIHADNALDMLTPTELAAIINILKSTKEGRIIESLWKFRDALKTKIDPSIADDVLDFWIAKHGEVYCSSRSLRQFLLSNWKVTLPIGVTVVSLPLFYLVFEASMIKKLGYEYGFLPTPIYDRMDSVIDRTYAVKQILKADPNSEEGLRLANEILVEMNWIIDYVKENPITEDPNVLEIAKTYWGPGIGSLNEESLNHLRLVRDLFIEEIGAIIGRPFPGGLPSELPETITAKVLDVLDGDTVLIEYAGTEYTCRLLGINTPESKATSYLIRRRICPTCEEERWNANKALYDEIQTWANTNMWHKNLVFKSDLDRQFDNYGRLLAVPFDGTIDLCKKELELGYAAVFFYDANKQVDVTEFLASEKIAKDAEIGIWSIALETGSIRCVSYPTAAEVWLDGVNTGKKTTSNVAYLENVAVGSHTITLKKIIEDTPQSCSVDVTVIKDSTVDAECTLSGFVPPPPEGKIHCKTLKPAGTSLSGAKIYLTGNGYENQYMGDTEKTITVPVGTYSIKYTYPEYEDGAVTNIVVLADLLSDATCSMTPSLVPVDKATWIIDVVKNELGETLSAAKVHVDDIYIGHYAPETMTFCEGCNCDAVVSCDFGAHTITIKKTGYADWVKTRTLVAGDSFTDSPVMLLPSADKFPVTIESIPEGATIEVDGTVI